jgi:iron complex outermembrane receptor protein
MKKLIYIGLSVIAFSAANFSIADELEEVIVTSSLIDPLASDISNPLHILEAKSITNDAIQSIGSLIDGLTGVSSNDFGAAVGQPIIRGLSGSRVKLLNNGKVIRDISSLGPDHANEIDLGHLQQIEIIRGPSSLLYANGAVGGIINIVDNTIAKQDIKSAKFNLGAGYEDGNSGNTGSASYIANINGLNLTSSFQYANLENYNIPEHALHKEGEHDDHGDHDPQTLENSDFAKNGFKLGLSKVEDWGYVGLSYADSSSTYGIPYHGDGHGDEHADDDHADDDHADDDHADDDHADDDHADDDHADDDHADDDHADDDHADHEGERIFADTNSETINFEGAFNFNGGLVKRADYYIRRTSYDHTEQHADEHGGHQDHGDDDHGDDDHGDDDHGDDDHGDDDHGDDDHGDEHHAEGTEFKNISNEFGLTLDIGQTEAIQKLTLNVAQEEFSITGHEAFLEPTKSDEITLGYFTSNKYELAHVDFGIRHDQIDRKSVAGSYNTDLTSYSATISRELSKELGVSLGISSAQKAPSAMELFVNGPHLVTQRF